ncbi:alpha-1,6-mannosyl-glycoprotein 2-beta-N-acetylglucosaminyltransferase isoform X1 [Nilaparvata lugens]|uniref:alpha-1,6-mannosyl-glycoprotein 2-beta-N-acetylglucosaminyltransferase isoform X1 n=2 Tax=Nilaparvata lugens TaxID=108931 RepID=UPI00193DFCF8|nr:alpha-1,6-mannosyl-glycoprotein 2-beta-N-acetylglucosaminyltransferase isoform X1 [Nilaparvata lugens]
MRRYQIASRVPESNSRFIAVCCCAEMRGGRRRTASCLRTAVFLFVVTFVWLQLHLTNLGGGGGQGGTLKDTTNDNDSSAAILSMVPQVLHKFLTSKPRNTTHSLNGSNMSVDAHRLTIDEIRHNIEKYNQMQTVHNEDLFGPLLNDSLIIVIQVHTRLIYLRHLIVSLAQAQEIDSTLLVFSHDYYNEEINEVVQSIDFAKVMQIFYPYSIQTHPNTFPGESPDDCPRDINYEQAVLRKCTNALHPDLYGHYREAKFTQTKHHWWWKANRVFNQLEVTRYHTGMVLFVEEDHYVAEDFIHILKLMEKTSKASCPACNILSLGTYLKTYDYYSESKKKEALRAMKRHQSLTAAAIPPSWGFQILPSLYQHYQKAEVTPWISSKHNMGMALNRSTWQELRKCGRLLCTYDDYNWDWSLQHVSQACLPHKLTAVVMRVPRIFHIGECGVHHKKANCQSTGVISKVQKVLANAAHHLYPSHLTLTFTTGAKKHKLRKGNGGWGDVRDHELCMNMTQVDR